MKPLPQKQRAHWWRWWITGLLLLATTINYMDRVTLANASVRVSAELGLTNAQYGMLELMFGWAFAIGSLVFGFLSDRIPTYTLYPLVLSAWSFAGIATGWSHDFKEMAVCRALLGFFEAGHWPCALKTTFHLLEEKDRTMGNSVLQSGASIGAVITPQLMKFLMTNENDSWRKAFFVVGALGFVWTLAWFIFLKPTDLKATSIAKTQNPRSSIWPILKSRRFWSVALLIVGAQTVWHIYRVWLMKFLQSGRGYEETAALNFHSLYYVATDAGCILAGATSLWLANRNKDPHQSRRVVYTLGCILTSFSIFIPWLEKGGLLLFIILIVGAGALALFPCYYSFVQDLSTAHVGRLTGILSLWVWAVTSPMHQIFGAIVDTTKSYDSVLLLAGLAPWLGVFSLKFLWPIVKNTPAPHNHAPSTPCAS